jgi:hypothetical protein
MIDWAAVARRLRYSSETAMWTVLYTDRQLSLPRLAAQFGVGVRSIRVALARCKIPIRARGGRRRLHPGHFTEDQVTRLRAEGLKSAALRLGISYYEIRKRIHQAEDFFAGRRASTAKPSS